MEKRTIAVLFGGKSSEHEVSLVSATSVLKNLNEEKYQVIMIGITKEGDWIHYDGAVEDIVKAEWEKNVDSFERVYPNPSPKKHSFLFVTPKGESKLVKIDVVFPVLHGANGEDGTVQGMMNLCGIPLVGCGCFASALCMDKAMAKSVLNQAGVLQARAVILQWDQDKELSSSRIDEIEKLGYPVFVKPSRAGSSVGVSKAKDREMLLQAVNLAFKEDTKVLVEEFIDGKEVEVAVLEERGRYTVSLPAEIDPGSEFYDYETKYVNDHSRFYIPARIGESLIEKVRTIAEKVFRSLDCQGLSRVDFFVTADGRIILNEVNTLPGFTSISMYPKLMTQTGMSYGELVDRLIESAR